MKEFIVTLAITSSLFSGKAEAAWILVRCTLVVYDANDIEIDREARKESFEIPRQRPKISLRTREFSALYWLVPGVTHSRWEIKDEVGGSSSRGWGISGELDRFGQDYRKAILKCEHEA